MRVFHPWDVASSARLPLGQDGLLYWTGWLSSGLFRLTRSFAIWCYGWNVLVLFIGLFACHFNLKLDLSSNSEVKLSTVTLIWICVCNARYEREMNNKERKRKNVTDLKNKTNKIVLQYYMWLSFVHLDSRVSLFSLWCTYVRLLVVW